LILPTPEEMGKTLADCGVMERFQEARIHHFPRNFISELNEGFFRGESFFLYGLPGVGKTHLCAALMYEKTLAEKAKVLAAERDGKIYLPTYPRMISIPRLFLMMRETFRSQGSETEASLIKYFAEKKCLLLDDLGKGTSGEWVNQTLYLILDTRYGDKRQTIVTSNDHLAEIAAKHGDPIASRIAGMCKVVEIKGADRRLN
jgi:DNA replication protein DnaC